MHKICWGYDIDFISVKKLASANLGKKMKRGYFVTLSKIRHCINVSGKGIFDLHDKENICLWFKKEFSSAFHQRNIHNYIYCFLF